MKDKNIIHKHLIRVKPASNSFLGVTIEQESDKAMATHCSTLAWKIPWAEELVGFSPWGRTESDMTEET